MANETIMVVDDERAIRLVLKRLLECQGYQLSECDGGDACLARVAEDKPDIILMDLKMPDKNGIEVLQELVARGVEAKIIIMTAHGTIGSAVEAIKQGAYDYITKPFDNSELLIVIQRALQHRKTEKELLQAKAQLDQKFKVNGIITTDPQMEKLLERVVRIAPSDASVLITGESGTGKELFAKAVHQESLRKHKPFVALNCSAIPADLIESELFGYQKGAFSGARDSKKGLVEMADKGTLFLDEISEMGFQACAKLLRFTQTGEFYSLGSTSPKKVDVRIVSASNRDITREIENKTFREDLFFRLNVVSIEIPPLRARVGDIIHLVDHFIGKDRADDLERPRFSAEALDLLQQYAWKGNVRELENVVRGTILFADGNKIISEDLPVQMRRSIAESAEAQITGNLNSLTSRITSDIEKGAILKALQKTGNNQTRAANELGISRRTLFRKLKKFGVTL